MSQLTVFDIWAEWCAPCRKFAPIFEKVSDEFPGAQFEKVNADENMDFLEYFGIRSIPTILIVRGTEVLYQHTGILSEPVFREVVNTYYSSKE